MRQRVALAVAVLLASTSIGSAVEIVDQQNATAPSGNINVGPHHWIGQEIVPNHTVIDFIDLFIADADPDVGSGCDFGIYVHDSAIYGTIRGEGFGVHALDDQANWYRFNMYAPVYVNPAKTYVIEVYSYSHGPGTENFMLAQGAANGYAWGRPIIEAIPANPNYPANDFLFTTGRHTNTSAPTSGSFQPFAYRGIVDADDDGDGDSFQAAHFVARRETPNITDENRTVFEFDVDRYFGAGSATISGTLHVNNATDTGERIVRLGVYGGDGLITVSDFEISATTVPETFSYHPPTDNRVEFNIDITDQLNALLESGEDFLGVRFGPANNQAPSVFVDGYRPKLNIIVPETGDFDFDLDRDATDIDLLFAAEQGAIPSAKEKFDVNFDDNVNSIPNTPGSDADVWVRQLKQTEYGDINLDGDVDFDDLLVVAQNYHATTGGWATGNIDGESGIHFGDLLLMAQSYGFSAIDVSNDVSSFSADFVADWSRAQSMIPEPAELGVLSIVYVLVRRRR